MEKLDELNSLGCIGEIDFIIEEQGIDFVKGLSNEYKKAKDQKKRIEYFSDKVIILTSKYDANLGEELQILEVIHRNAKNKQVEFYYIPNRSLYASFLLYLINKAESS